MSDKTLFENEALIYSVINKYIKYFDKDDLYQVGVLGLINAYKNYKDDKNTKFSSYAYFYILGEVKKYIRESNTFKISKELTKINISIEKAKIVLSQKLQREPNDFEIALFLEIDEKQVEEAKMANQLVNSLDEENEDENCLYNKVSVFEKEYESDILDLRIELERLDDFSKKLIDERYINDKSQSETSSILGITQVQVSRKEKEILSMLRTRLM